MDNKTRLELIKSVGEEIITEDELKHVVETNQHPIAYDGFEPSGLAHLPFGIFRPLLLKDLGKAGVRFKLFLADWHAWVNNKMGGDMERIRDVGKYFIEVWKAGGVDTDKVEFIWASDIMDKEYWRKVVLIAKNTTVNRATRALTIMGRKSGEMLETAQYFYPMMQTADIFQLDVDICQLGLDQRRANMIAREIAPKMKWKKPVIVSHHMLMGLEGVKTPDGFETDKKMDAEISSKMSKSKPNTCIYVHDTEKQIREKIASAYCAPKDVENNPMLDYAKYIVFRKKSEFRVDRPQKFGGPVIFGSCKELEAAFRQGTLHPLDLKNSVATYINEFVAPIREHFETNKKARELYEFVKKQEITR
jgi:tyrosyl-tRNA synthetase